MSVLKFSTALLVAFALPAMALDTAPTDTIVLTVSGEISEHNQNDTAVFDIEMLSKLPVTEFTTSTIWTEGEVNFTGVSLDVLLEQIGGTGTTMFATAINDYAVEIPVSDAQAGGPIVAYLMDGQPMSVRDKGPLWIVYPYDSNADFQSEIIYSRSIWQLDRIEFAN